MMMLEANTTSHNERIRNRSGNVVTLIILESIDITILIGYFCNFLRLVESPTNQMRINFRYLFVALVLSLVVVFLFSMYNGRDNSSIPTKVVKSTGSVTSNPQDGSSSRTGSGSASEMEPIDDNSAEIEKPDPNKIIQDTETAYVLIVPRIMPNLTVLTPYLGKLLKYKNSAIISDTKSPFIGRDFTVLTFTDIENTISTLIRAGQRYPGKTSNTRTYLALYLLQLKFPSCTKFTVETYGTPGIFEGTNMDQIKEQMPFFVRSMNYFTPVTINLDLKRMEEPVISYNKVIETMEKYAMDKMDDIDPPEMSKCQQEFVEPDCSILRKEMVAAEKQPWHGVGDIPGSPAEVHDKWPYAKGDYVNTTDFLTAYKDISSTLTYITEGRGKTFTEDIPYDMTRLKINKMNLIINKDKFPLDRDHVPIILTWQGRDWPFFNVIESLKKVKNIEKTMLIVFIATTENLWRVTHQLHPLIAFCQCRVFYHPHHFDRRVWYHGIREYTMFLHVHLMVQWDMGYKYAISLKDTNYVHEDFYIRLKDMVDAKERGLFGNNVVSIGATPYVEEYQCDYLAWVNCNIEKGLCGPKDKNLYLKARSYSPHGAVLTREVVSYYRRIFSGGVHVSPDVAIQSMFAKHEYYQIQPCAPLLHTIPLQGAQGGTGLPPAPYYDPSTEKTPEVFIISEKDPVKRLIKL
jgi:hypothetical protein